MSQDTRGHYEFADLPINPVRPGTSLLVAGPALSGTQELALRMLAAGERHNEGTLFIAADESGEELLADYTAQGGTFDRGRMAAIECGGPQVESDDQNIRTVRSPSDLTGIGIEYSSLYEGLHGEGIDRVRTGVFTVSTLLMYTDEIQPVYRFLHTLTGRVRSADGFGVCVVDPTTQDDQTLSSVIQTFDGRVDLRTTDDGGAELRVQGVRDQPDGWQRL
jgi:KaiC/GvpD/RAD55 family RecA-like ATPase